MSNEEPMLRYFSFTHLPDGELRETSSMFASLAEALCDQLPPSPERSKALNELKIAKDWAVIAAVDVAKSKGDTIVTKKRDRLDSPDLAPTLQPDPSITHEVHK